MLAVQQRRDRQADPIVGCLGRERIGGQLDQAARIIGARVGVGEQRGDVPVGAHPQPGQRETRDLFHDAQRHHLGAGGREQGAQLAGVARLVVLGDQTVVVRPHHQPFPRQIVLEQGRDDRERGRAARNGDCQRTRTRTESLLESCSEPVGDRTVVCAINAGDVGHRTPPGRLTWRSG